MRPKIIRNDGEQHWAYGFKTIPAADELSPVQERIHNFFVGQKGLKQASAGQTSALILTLKYPAVYNI